jgi:porin
MRQWPALVVLTFLLASGSATRSDAAAKDESVAGWFPLIPSWFKDWRNGLADKGLALRATFVMDNIGNPTGGMRQGAINFGRFDLGVDADLEKLVGWSGAKIHANTFSIYGRGLTRNYIGNLAPVSEIEALPDVRLFETYIEQSLLGGALAIKLGQQAADVEFFDSKTDDLFVNNTFSWPAINASDLPAGGPASTIAAMGARVKYRPIQGITAFAAIFNGTASDPGPGDPQRRDHHGLAFRMQDDPWLIGQVQFDYAIGSPSGPLAGAFTPGAWYHTGTFADQRFTNDSSLLAGPDGSGMPARLRGNFGIFATVEQTLYKPASVTDRSLSASTRGITAFARVAYSPPDRNLIDFYADGGLGVADLVPGRPLDRFGMAIAYMHISRGTQAFDRDSQIFSGLPTPVRSAETLFEMIYEAHIKPGWLLAPYFQYVFRPSGGIANPFDPTGLRRIGDAAVFGLTSTLKY